MYGSVKLRLLIAARGKQLPQEWKQAEQGVEDLHGAVTGLRPPLNERCHGARGLLISLSTKMCRFFSLIFFSSWPLGSKQDTASRVWCRDPVLHLRPAPAEAAGTGSSAMLPVATCKRSSKFDQAILGSNRLIQKLPITRA